ncbi:MAG TPA: glycosyltransferase, partial [Chthoniobacterales bacterium]
AGVIESADLGIVPKRNDSFGNEAFSTKILEFMATGVPVIVSDTLIDKYYFDDSIVCFFQAGNEQDLARCMLQLIRDPERRRWQSEQATRFVEKTTGLRGNTIILTLWMKWSRAGIRHRFNLA